MLLRRSTDRGHVSLGWLDSRHTFSFGHYYDPAWMGFGPLRVINQDRVQPGKGFGTHGHANMEIISVVLSGALEHRDSTGGGGVIEPDDVQLMSAGHGVEHSEFNASSEATVEFLQIWIQPDRVNASPRYAQRRFDAQRRHGRLCRVVGPQGGDDALPIRQQAALYRGTLLPGEPLRHVVPSGRRAWVQVVSGALAVSDIALDAGDGLGLDAGERVLQARGEAPCDVLVFDLP